MLEVKSLEDSVILKYADSEIYIAKKDVPKVIEQLNESIRVFCLGITDVVYDKDRKIIGYVGFHDSDHLISIDDLKGRLAKLVQALETSVFAFRTHKGFHIVSFEIFDKKKYYLWRKVTRQIFPSDYKKQPPRILRLSGKGKFGKPKFITFYHFQNNNQWSSGHMKAYWEHGLLDKKHFPYFVNLNLKETIVTLCVYPSVERGV